MLDISGMLADMQAELATFQDLEALHVAAAERRTRLTRLFDSLQSRAAMLGSEAAAREQMVGAKADQLMVRPPALGCSGASKPARGSTSMPPSGRRRNSIWLWCLLSMLQRAGVGLIAAWRLQCWQYHVNPLAQGAVRPRL